VSEYDATRNPLRTLGIYRALVSNVSLFVWCLIWAVLVWVLPEGWLLVPVNLIGAAGALLAGVAIYSYLKFAFPGPLAMLLACLDVVIVAMIIRPVIIDLLE
jgi:hypothetical protein